MIALVTLSSPSASHFPAVLCWLTPSMPCKLWAEAPYAASCEVYGRSEIYPLVLHTIPRLLISRSLLGHSFFLPHRLLTFDVVTHNSLLWISSISYTYYSIISSIFCTPQVLFDIILKFVIYPKYSVFSSIITGNRCSMRDTFCLTCKGDTTMLSHRSQISVTLT